MPHEMRDGSVVEDIRLGRLEQFDERSRNYRALELPTAKGPRSYTWRVMTGAVGGTDARGDGRWLDQGREGACVGFGITHEAAARPKEVEGLTGADAMRVYRRAQKLDPWPGESYSGTSVLAGMKAAVEEGWFDEYRWAFGEEELWQVVGRTGPAIIGIPWYSGMYRLDEFGYVNVSGSVVGGHCLLVTGQSKRRNDYELLNSWWRWGPGRITREDLARLLSENGEAVIPVTRLFGDERDER